MPSWLLSSALLFSFAACGSDPVANPDAGGPLPTPDGGAPLDAGPTSSTTAVTLTVGGVFPAGTRVKNAYDGASATVEADGTVKIEPGASGVILLERDGAAPTPFTWKNATIYFVVTDRFFNGDPTNDHSYGRQSDGDQEIGTWHGGDLKGLTSKLDHIASLGVNALWITSPVEQVHGWVGGGSGEFKHYGYHGYWALDFTKMDQNLGSPQDLQDLVAAAHQRGIRVILDVVMNHPGYATGADLLEYLPSVIDPAFATFTPGAGQNWGSWNDLVDYQSVDWVNWWGVNWIRATFPGHNQPGMTDVNRSLTFLPDFRTEDPRATTLPPFYARKPDTAATALADTSVREYLVAWHAAWVREYGIDGFRCDTAKHVELDAWKELKEAGTAALAEWKAANPAQAIDDAPFWMTAEVFPHNVGRDAYYDNGFDSVINFDFQQKLTTVLDDTAALDAVYTSYAAAIAGPPSFEILSYASSHDTSLYFQISRQDLAKQARLATAMLMLPGGVQIFYGDETARPAGPGRTDPVQGTRSDMNWDHQNAALLSHWQKLGTFRNKHAAIGAGAHGAITIDRGYAFSRTLGDDAVVVAQVR